MSAKSEQIFFDTEIAGVVGDGFGIVEAERLGRALGTFARRRERGICAFVIGRRPDDAAALLRDGLVRGLVLAGHDVVDIAVCEPKPFSFALEHLRVFSGIFIERLDDGRHSLELTLATIPMVGQALRVLAGIYDEGVFAAGAGALKSVDIDPAWRAAGDWNPRFDSTSVDL